MKVNIFRENILYENKGINIEQRNKTVSLQGGTIYIADYQIID